MKMNHKKFVFIHIPKTAGVSVFKSLQDCILDVQGKYIYMHADRRTQESLFYGHVPSWQLMRQGYIEPGYFDDAFIFCIIRNVWDRAVSAYFHFDQETKGVSFRDFLLTVPRDRDTYSHNRAQSFWLRDLPHYQWLTFEGDPTPLQKQFDFICEYKLEIEPRELEFWNKGTRYSCTAAEMYERNPGTKELVEDIYWKDIQTFGQTFPY